MPAQRQSRDSGQEWEAIPSLVADDPEYGEIDVTRNTQPLDEPPAKRGRPVFASSTEPPQPCPHCTGGYTKRSTGGMKLCNACSGTGKKGGVATTIPPTIYQRSPVREEVRMSTKKED